jgi:hypothetical protein
MARPGDLILISPGVYHEQVTVATPQVVLRGVDRGGVILDGAGQMANGVHVRADGVAVENLTVRGYTATGVLVARTTDAAAKLDARDPVRGYRIAYVTTRDNTVHGIWANGARSGLIDHSYAAGSNDAGVTVSRCRPCNTVVTDTIGERNSVGFLARNASDELFVVRSTWRANRVGMVSGSFEEGDSFAPQSGTTFAGNLVTDNGNRDAPETSTGAYGMGIVLAGSAAAQVIRNRVAGNPGVGVAVTDLGTFGPTANEVRDNALAANGTDLSFFLIRVTSSSTARNCFAGNIFQRSTPPEIEATLACGVDAKGRPDSFPPPRLPLAPTPGTQTSASGGARTADPAPADVTSMPSAAADPAEPPPDVTPGLKLGTIVLPPG